VQEQAQILAKKTKLPRGSTEASGRIDREANEFVAKNIRKLVKAGEHALVIELLRLSSSLSLVPFVAALRSLMTAHRSDELDELFRLMRSKHILPPASVFNEVVAYFALGACQPASRTGSSSQRHSKTESTHSTANMPNKNRATEAKRAKLFFNDLKSVYVPSAATYEALWLLIPSNSSSPFIMTAEHEALWQEMRELAVVPTERIFMRYLQSIRAQWKLNPNRPATTKNLETQLDHFERVCRHSFGFNSLLMQTSASAVAPAFISSVEKPKYSISGKLVKSWMKAVATVSGEMAAFRLASIMCQVAPEGVPKRAATTVLEAGATIRAHSDLSGKSEKFSEISDNSEVLVIPTEFCPYEPLIEVLSQKGKNHLVVQAWNLMSPMAKADAAPSTIAAVATAANPAVHQQLFESFPVVSKVDAVLLMTFLSLASTEGNRQLIETILNFISGLSKPFVTALIHQKFYEQACDVFKTTDIADRLHQLQRKHTTQ
jgi:hypothetical protein